MSRIPQTPRRATPLVLAALGLGVALLLIVLSAASAPQQAQAPQPAPVPHFVDLRAPGAPRVVVVGAASVTLPGTSNTAGVLMANLREGRIPEGAASAIVLSDSNCAPDADGISHCLNDLQIGSMVVTVQHHHAMAEVPCLSPGERVTLMTLEQYQRQI